MSKIYTLGFLLLVALQVMAQQNPPKFFLYNVDTTKYPQITANVYAVDGNNLRYTNLNVNEFDLFESGNQRDATLSIRCDTVPEPLPIAVCLVLDQSGSMNDRTSSGDTYWDWVRFGAKSFINQIVFVPPSVVAITSFGGEAFLRRDFETTKPPLINAIDQIPNEGATNYDEAFLNTSQNGGPNGAVTVLRRAPIMLKRILIILTDGQPDKTPQTQRIIDSCWKNNITVYAINLKTPKNQNINLDLQKIVTATGGKAYLAGSKQELANIYNQIALEIQRNIDCRITWTSFPGCTQQSRNRTLQAVFKRPSPAINWSGSYLAPATSLATPRASVSTITFTDPGTGGKQQKTIRVYAPSAITTRILNCSITVGGLYFKVISVSKPLPSTMQPNDSIDVLIEFTQDQIGKTHTGTLNIDGDICDINVPINVIIPVVKLETPKGGEVYSGCDTIHITWSGVPEDEPVSLSYSTNNGTNWQGIVSNATGLQYVWSKPVEHNQYKVRVQRNSCNWINVASSTGYDSLTSISFSPYWKKLSVSGCFENSMTLKTNVIVSLGRRDGLFSILNTNSTVDKLVSISGTEDEVVTNVAADSVHTWVVAGTTNSKQITVAGTLKLTLSNLKNNAIFISKIDSLGNAVWVSGLANNTTSSTGDCYPISLHVRNDNIIILQGFVRGSITSVYTGSTFPVKSLTVPDYKNLYFPFTAEIAETGEITALYYSFNTAYKHELIRKRITTYNNIMYEAGTFINQIDCGNTIVQSKGNTDGYIRATQLNTVYDQSKTAFTIKKPNLSFQRQLIGFPTTDVGKSVVPFPYPINDLENTGNLPLVLNSLTFVGQDTQDFSIVNSVAPGIIPASNGAILQIDYSPKLVNRRNRNVYLIAEGDCTPPAFTTFFAEATFPKLTIDEITFGEYRLKTVHHDTISIVNSDPAAVIIKSISTSANTNGAFTWNVLFPNAKDSVVQGNSTLKIAVDFAPQIEPKDSILFTIAAAGLSEPLISKATGSGFLPKASARGYTFKTVPVNTTSGETGSVVIYNTDNRVPLHVYNSLWNSSKSDNSFTISNPIVDKIIPPLDSIVLTVNYTPLTTGTHSAQYIFDHDAATGPDTLPHARDTVWITADANDAELSSYSYTFPALLSCGKDSTTFTLYNRSDNTPLDVTSVKITGDVDVFRVSPTTVQQLAAKNGKQLFTVYYNPLRATSSQATIVIIHSAGTADTFKVNGQATDATLVFEPFSTAGNAEDYRFIPLKAKLTSSIPFLLDTLTIVVQTNPTHALFAKDTLQLLYNDWKWDLDSNGTSFIFHGKHTGGGVPPGEIEFLQFPVYLFLSKPLTSYISYNGIAQNFEKCLHIAGDSAKISVEPVCFWTGRSITLAPGFAVAVKQSQTNDLEVHYSLPYSSGATIELYNVLGMVEYSTKVYYSPTGTNFITLPEGVVHCGMYFCKLSFENLSTVHQFYITK